MEHRLIEIFQQRRSFAYAVVSPELRLVSTSPSFDQFIPYNVNASAGTHITDIFDAFVGVEPALQKILDGRQDYFILENINVGDSEANLRYLSFYAYALDQNNPAGGLLVLVEDITPSGRLRQQMMQDGNSLRLAQIDLEHANQVAKDALEQARRELAERERAEAALRANQELLFNALDIANMAAWDEDVLTGLLTLNNQFMTLLGVTPDQMGGYSIHIADFQRKYVHVDDQPLFSRQVSQVDRIREPDYHGYFEIRLLCGPRGVRYFLVEFRLEMNEFNRPVRAFGYLMDITERKEAQLALAQRTQELEAVVQELNAFSFSVSHDLRAPLRALQGYSKILLEDYAPSLDADGQHIIGSIQSAAQRMDVLIKDLLQFSHMSHKELQKQRVQPGLLAQQAFDETMTSYTGRSVEFILSDVPDCQADPVLLYQVFMNLINNAIKFSANRSPARVEVGWQEENHVYFVRDNGVGFDMDHAQKLFGVFQRLHSRAEFEGTGLGLAIVQRIIHRHGGRVWANAIPHQGAVFYFTLE